MKNKFNNSLETMMSNKQRYTTFLSVSVLFFASIACDFFAGLRTVSDISEAKITEVEMGVETVQTVATTIEPKATEIRFYGTAPAVASVVVPTLIDSRYEKPEDIPLMNGTRTSETILNNHIFYYVDAGFDDVVDFYEREMVANGWTKNEAESKINPGYDQLVFEKDNRIATVYIEDFRVLNNIMTIVTIDIE